MVNHLIHDEDYQGDNGGSNHHEQGRFHYLLLGGPRGLVTEFVVSLLYIRK